ncbi:polyphosphate kinase [Haematobacter massiliensis]|uniref:Polyphosphate kinase n=1 Tax=Haematobacter massiliensis TaxID=195105 RepID=A0A086XXG0_9RHOB|nr:VOC family protein [Haematobacter massiliensis]KFI26710.1 polyphosphate kinase [Haematobacter massiliensis]OWJ70720.1 polyphosphate kinase [Haematobacter massiliensis]OWJ81344.1 polyphosphate kinase [Haematobacter massiliensis]QBJ23747.1 VOC family protein [Haematobacter massiliensis]
MAVIDHLVVSAATLEDGAAFVEANLGVAPGGGGEHPLMATHNRLLGAGEAYLEVISAAPHLTPPCRPRWFGLDGFTGPARLTNWVLAVPDLTAALRHAPPGTGVPQDLTRGDLAWRFSLSENGELPFDGIFPALIEWQGVAHPVQRLGDTGIELVRLELRHPDAPALTAALAPFLADARVTVQPGAPGMMAWFETPLGLRSL